MKRYDDIQELLLAVSGNIVEIDRLYAESSKDENIIAVSRPLVKSSMEHLRSCLDYCAQDIHEKKIGGKKRVYFPYGGNIKKFKESVSTNLQGIDILAPKIYNLIHDMQPFACNDPWLVTLCKQTNFIKHNSLFVPDRVNSPGSTTTVGNIAQVRGNGSIVMDNCIVNGVPVGGKYPLIINAKRSVRDLQNELPKSIRVARRYDWVEFRINGTTTDVLCLIKTSFKNISGFVLALSCEI